MAKRQGSAKTAQAARVDTLPSRRPEIYTAEYAGYLVCDLTVAHEKALETYTPTYEELYTWQSEMVDSGLKLVATYSKDGASVRAELHDMDKSSDYAGWRLSSFAEDLYTALSILMYKHKVVLSEDWSLAGTERQKRRYG